MITIHYRPANDLDLKALTEGRGSLAHNVMTVSLPVAALVFGFVYIIWHSLPVAGMVAVGLFFASLASNLSFFRKVERPRSLEKDSTAVEVFETSAQRVLDIEPLGDNAPALCFFVGDRKALLLVGQWLLEYDSFPAESFRVHRWRETKECIRIEVTGPQIEPEHSTARLRPSHRFRQLQIIDAAPETLQQDLDRAFDR
jgi:hypothetical protein